ncbi:MAG: OmpH family outer membrane protein [Nitrococcus sp.]|nr:OmpH family outer membrane protein [Nitrococcus sp.]
MNIRNLLAMLGATVLLVVLTGTVGAAELKIGFVNPAQVSAQAPQAEAVRQKLEKEFAPRDREIVALQKDLSELQDRLQRDAAVMSDEKRLELQREIIARRRDIERTQEAFSEDFNMRRNEALANLQRRIFEAVSGFAKEQGFDLIIAGGVLYASQQVDVTQQIIERLREDYQQGLE